MPELPQAQSVSVLGEMGVVTVAVAAHGAAALYLFMHVRVRASMSVSTLPVAPARTWRAWRASLPLALFLTLRFVPRPCRVAQLHSRKATEDLRRPAEPG